MVRPAAGWLALVVALGGCAAPPPPLVFVDLDRAAAATPLSQSIGASPQPPDSPGASSANLPALGARRLDFSENASRLEKVQLEVRIAQEETIRQLTTELRQAYLKEVDELERSRLGSISNVRRDAFDAAWKRMRSRFAKYADERAPDAIRLAVYAGFPNPGARLDRPLVPWSNAEKRQLEEGRQLRTKLQALKAEFDADMNQMIAEAGEEVAAALSALRVEMESRRADAERRAREEADRQGLELTRDLESVLSGKSEVLLAPRPGVRVGTDAVPPVPLPPKLNTDAAQRPSRETVRSEIRIWAAQHGVRVTEMPGATDRTEEFLEWRKQHHPGPWAN